MLVNVGLLVTRFVMSIKRSAKQSIGKYFQNGIENLTLRERLETIAVKASFDYISEIVGPDLQDGCNLSDDENDEQETIAQDLRTSNSGRLVSQNSLHVLKLQFVSRQSIE